MDKHDIRRVIGRLETDDGMEYRLAEKLSRGVSSKALYRTSASIAAGLVMIIGTGSFMYSHIATDAKLGRQNQTVSTESTIAQVPDTLTGKSDQQTPEQSPGMINEPPNADQGKEAQVPKSDNSPVQKSTLPPSNNTGHQNSEANQNTGISPNTGSEVPNEMQPKSDNNSDSRPMLRNGSADSTVAPLFKNINDQNKGISIPKIQLPSDTALTVQKMMGLIVYQGRIFVQSSSSEDLKDADKLVGEKLGTTKGNLTDWSTQTDNAVELASSVGIQNVYTVKGYDKSFRIMTYGILNGAAYAQFFECLNGITVKTGNDVFGKFNIENHVNTIKYEDFDSWNSGKNNYRLLTQSDSFASFLAALENSIPYEEEGLSYLFDDSGLTSQKCLQIKLNDGTVVNLRLFKDGYVYYNGVNVFFKVEDSAFKGLWNELN